MTFIYESSTVPTKDKLGWANLGQAHLIFFPVGYFLGRFCTFETFINYFVLYYNSWFDGL